MSMGLLNQRVVNCPRCRSHTNQVRIDPGGFDRPATDDAGGVTTWQCLDRCHCVYAICTVCGNYIPDAETCLHCAALASEAKAEADKAGANANAQAIEHADQFMTWWFEPVAARFDAGDPVIVTLPSQAGHEFAVARYVSLVGVEVRKPYGEPVIIIDAQDVTAIMTQSIEQLGAEARALPDDWQHPAIPGSTASVQPADATAATVADTTGDTTGASGSDTESGAHSAISITADENPALSVVRLYQTGDVVMATSGDRIGEMGQVTSPQLATDGEVQVKFDDGQTTAFQLPGIQIVLMNPVTSPEQSDLADEPDFYIGDAVVVVGGEHDGKTAYVTADQVPGQAVRVMLDEDAEGYDIEPSMLKLAEDTDGDSDENDADPLADAAPATDAPVQAPTPAAPDKPLCAATTLAGNPCKGRPVADGLCAAHQPRPTDTGETAVNAPDPLDAFDQEITTNGS